MNGAVQLCISASYPNFQQIVQQEYHQITRNQEIGTSGFFENRDEHKSHNLYYVDGFQDEKKFLCTGHPTGNSVEDFFKTLWKEHIHIIVSLSRPTLNNANQCYQYWSKEQNGVLQAGQYQMKTVKIKKINNFVVTELHLKHGNGPSLQLCHFLYSDWTVSDVPCDVTKFFQFILKVNHLSEMAKRALKLHQVSMSPIVVHSTHGSSKIGTICASDFAIYQINRMAWMSLPNIVTDIRRQLRSQVMSPEQYYFCTI
ncbi:tyrosine-protein phosphatase non-receptor type 9-like [Cotesia glomerata]|uniref:tyrosine-protein phosphatase non-receptor type 9-like n=1 Tax=Cotesia glomerata TaxID=32391 RepID=UPI001D02AD07|nr:tyrosine-protein phosphatase non-receptor type 9-like [Cotesia glomerata]